MQIFYSGFNNSSIFSTDEDAPVIIDKFTKLNFTNISNVNISWNYLLLWRENELYLTGDIIEENIDKKPLLLKIPEEFESCVQASPGKEDIFILSSNNNIWQYKIFEQKWKKVSVYIPSTQPERENEYFAKICRNNGSLVGLTNLGRVFNVPLLLDVPKRVKFIDVACGFDHTILLAENGDIYSIGMGSRGQLGHEDLEDMDNPSLIHALAGIKIKQIASAGWHSAVITEEGDLYTWGWNNSGQLGIEGNGSKVVAVPTLVEFKNEEGIIVNKNVKKVECGNAFTICMLEDDSLWGCGSNKYGQLGCSPKLIEHSKKFVKLDICIDIKKINNFKCHEWGTVIITE